MKLFPNLLLLAFALLVHASVARESLAPAAVPPLPPTILPAVVAADAPITVTPDRADWTYPLGAPASFRIAVAADPYPADGVPIRYRLGPEMIEGAEKDAVVPAGGLVLPVSAPADPGFVRCIVTATLNGKSVRALATVGFAPETLVPTQTEPSDFDAFWADQKAALAKVPPDYQLTPAPELSTPGVEVSYLSFQNVGGWAGPSRFYGVLCVPRGPGPFPAVLNVPGAGVRPYKGLVGLAEKGVITLQVGVNGIPVNLPPELYDSLGRGALSDYARINLDDRSRYYFRRIYLGCLRANDYLVSHPKWDGKNLLVRGGSQGGQLSIVTASLDPRVTALAASFPAYSDTTGYLYGRAGGWPGLFRPNANNTPGDAPIEAKVVTTAYYDTVNFARRLKVPGFYAWGYNDEVCPPTSTFCAYNVITAPKQLLIALERGHSTSPEQDEKVGAWVLERLGITPAQP